MISRIQTTMTIDGKQLKVVKVPHQSQMVAVTPTLRKPIKFNSTQSFNRSYNANSNNSNNSAMASPSTSPTRRKMDVSPVFDKFGNRIGVRRYTGKVLDYRNRLQDSGQLGTGGSHFKFPLQNLR